MFPRSLYSWTKSWCSPKTKTKTRFLNVKRNLLATRPTERSASRCAHSPEISSFSYIYTHACVIYIYKRVCLHQTNKEKFVSIREHFGVLGLNVAKRWIVDRSERFARTTNPIVRLRNGWRFCGEQRPGGRGISV